MMQSAAGLRSVRLKGLVSQFFTETSGGHRQCWVASQRQSGAVSRSAFFGSRAGETHTNKPPHPLDDEDMPTAVPKPYTVPEGYVPPTPAECWRYVGALANSSTSTSRSHTFIERILPYIIPRSTSLPSRHRWQGDVIRPTCHQGVPCLCGCRQ
jgi:hypothetical protein